MKCRLQPYLPKALASWAKAEAKRRKMSLSAFIRLLVFRK
jgi:hypothetical protein